MSTGYVSPARHGPIPAQVFACLRKGELRVILFPGVGLADGGQPFDIPIDKVPIELRMPNTDLWVRVNQSWEVQEVWRRECEDVELA